MVQKLFKNVNYFIKNTIEAKRKIFKSRINSRKYSRLHSETEVYTGIYILQHEEVHLFPELAI